MSGEEDANPLGVVLHMDDDAVVVGGPSEMKPEMTRGPSSPLARGGKFASSSGSPLTQSSTGGLRTTPLNPARLTRGPSEFNLRSNEQQRTPTEHQRAPSAYALSRPADLQPPSQPSSPPALLVPSIQPFETDVVPHPKSSSKPTSPKRSTSEPMFLRETSHGLKQYVPAAVALFLALLTLCMLAYVWWRVDNVERTVAGYTAGQSVGMQAAQVDNALLVASTLSTSKAEFGTATGDFAYARPVAPTGVAASASVVQGQDATSEAGGDLILRSGQGGGVNSAKEGDIILQLPGTAPSGARRLLVDSPNARNVVTISGGTASYRLSASSVNFASDSAINMQATKVIIDAPLQTPIHNVSLIAAQQFLTLNFASLPGGAIRLQGAMTSSRVSLQFTGCAGSTAISTLHLINGLNVDVQVPSSACRRPTNVPAFDVFVRAGDSAAFTCWAGSLQCPLDGAIVSLNQRLANITAGGATSGSTGGTGPDLTALLLRLDALEAAMALKANLAALTDLSANVTTALAAGVAAQADVAALNTGLAAKADLTAVNTALLAKADATDVTTALLAKADATALAGLASTASVTAALALKANISELAAYATVDAVNLKADASALSAYALASDLAAKANESDLATKADASALAGYVLTSTLADYALTSALANYSLSADVATALAAKADTTDVASTYATIASVATQLAPLAVRADMDAALDLKANVTDVASALALKADIALLSTYAFSADLSSYSTTAQTNLTIATAIAKALENVVDVNLLNSTIGALQNSIYLSGYSTTAQTDLIVTAAIARALVNVVNITLLDSTAAALQNSFSTLNSLKADTTTVDALSQQVATNTADIALRATTSMLTLGLNVKADVTALAAVESAVALKANSSTVTMLTSQIATNTADINLRPLTSAVDAALALKADASALAVTNSALVEALALKANLTDLATLATTAALTTGLAGKADVTDLAAVSASLSSSVSTLNASLSAKASVSSVTALSATVTDLSTSKLSVADFTSFQTDNTAALDTKALATDLLMKADLSQLDMYALKTDLALKADISMVPKYAQIDWFYPLQHVELRVMLISSQLGMSPYSSVLDLKTLRTGHNQWTTDDTWDMNAPA